jgi:uncharacterized protein (DUF58 family)
MDEATRRLLDPATIARAEALGISARFVVEGYMAGEHRSPYRGFAVEFSQHREYAPGDDVRHLDWKVLGRTDRHYIKQYQQETNFIAHLLVDSSESMAYGSGEVTKFEYARAAAACLAYLVLQQRDAVALGLFRDEVVEYLPRSDNRRQLFEVTSRLAAAVPGGPTRLPEVLHDLAARLRRRGIVVVLSDFLGDDDNAVLGGLQHLRFQGHEVVGLHVVDPFELEFPFAGLVEFEGLEGAPSVKTRPAEVRESYLREFGAFEERLRAGFARSRCHFVRARTDAPLDEVLGTYLASRQDPTGGSRAR